MKKKFVKAIKIKDEMTRGSDEQLKYDEDEMIKRQAKGGTPYLLTAAIPATSWGAGSDRFDFATLNKYLDYVNMMSYDLDNKSAKRRASTRLNSIGFFLGIPKRFNE